MERLHSTAWLVDTAERWLMGEASRFDDATGRRQTSRTPGSDAGPESAANPSKHADLLGFAALTTSLLQRMSQLRDLKLRHYRHLLSADAC